MGGKIPVDVDAQAMWAELERLIRVDLPAALTALGFELTARRFRSMRWSGHPNRTELSALAREARGDVWSVAIGLAQTAGLHEDPLERLRARQEAHNQRFEHAAVLIGLAVDVAGVWCVEYDAYRPGTTVPQAVAIGMRMIAEARTALGVER